MLMEIAEKQEPQLRRPRDVSQKRVCSSALSHVTLSHIPRGRLSQAIHETMKIASSTHLFLMGQSLKTL